MAQKSAIELRAAIARLFNMPTDNIGGVILLFETPAGTEMFHTVCCHEHAKEVLREVAKEKGVDMTEGNPN